MRLAFLIIFLAFASSVFATTYTPSCDYLSISNACAIAVNGDVIVIQPGSCTISNTINLNNVTLRGSGTNLTTLISGAGLQQVFQSGSITADDLNCVGDSGNINGFFVAYGGICHFYNIQMTNVTYRGISFSSGAFGLVDHCVFVNQPGDPQPISVKGAGYVSWAGANPLGTTNAAYVEDCYFDASHSTNTGSGQGNGFFDAYDGAQLVFRHNFCVQDAPTGVHGYDSQPTSTRTWEIYDNIFTNMTTGSGVFSIRGGTGVVFSNQVFGASTFCQLAYFRSSALNHSSTVGGYGKPGQGYVITNTGNFTDSQQINLIENTSYFFYTTYNTGGNWQGQNGYGGGNVVIGATLHDSLTNLIQCINQGTGVGVIYNQTLSIDSGHTSGFNHDFIALGIYTNTAIANSWVLVLTNALDGNTDQYGYPAAFAEGVINAYPLTSATLTNNQVLLPCYSWGNVMNGSDIGFTLLDTDDPQGTITNLLKLNRDYYNDTSMPGYVSLVYPHPLQAGENTNSTPMIADYTKTPGILTR